MQATNCESMAIFSNPGELHAQVRQRRSQALQEYRNECWQCFDLKSIPPVASAEQTSTSQRHFEYVLDDVRCLVVKIPAPVDTLSPSTATYKIEQVSRLIVGWRSGHPKRRSLRVHELISLLLQDATILPQRRALVIPKASFGKPCAIRSQECCSVIIHIGRVMWSSM